MNKLIRLSPTGIEYGDYAWNFASGCGNNVDGRCKGGGFKCWAYPITQRFAERYPNGFKPTIYPNALLSPLYLKKPSRILCAFMGDLFGDGFSPTMMVASENSPYGKDLKTKVYDTINACPQHTFLFLTKQPQNLIKFSPFPDNCWVGFSAVDTVKLMQGLSEVEDVRAKLKFISIEPFLDWSFGWTESYLVNAFQRAKIKWVIIGAQTCKSYWELAATYPNETDRIMKLGRQWTFQPKIEWVKDIVDACDEAKIPVFIKNNLFPLFEKELNYLNKNWLRQEMPNLNP